MNKITLVTGNSLENIYETIRDIINNNCLVLTDTTEHEDLKLLFTEDRTQSGILSEFPDTRIHPKHFCEFFNICLGEGKKDWNNRFIIICTFNQDILNQIRKAVKLGLILSSEVDIIHDGYKVEIGNNGEINTWPDGFFDQTKKDFEILFGV